MANPHCECPVAGWCQRHQIEKIGRQYDLCRGTANTADCGYKYWAAWETGQLGATAVNSPILDRDWDCTPADVVASSPSLQKVDGQSCVHRGEAIRTEGCKSCRGNVQVKVFACSEFGECTIAKKIGSAAMCYGCSSFSKVDG